MGNEKERTRRSQGESRVQLSYACVGDPFPPPSSFYSSLATLSRRFTFLVLLSRTIFIDPLSLETTYSIQ